MYSSIQNLFYNVYLQQFPVYVEFPTLPNMTIQNLNTINKRKLIPYLCMFNLSLQEQHFYKLCLKKNYVLLVFWYFYLELLIKFYFRIFSLVNFRILNICLLILIIIHKTSLFFQHRYIFQQFSSV